MRNGQIIGFKFDDVFIDLQNRRLRRRNEILTLSSRYFDVLVLLVSRPNQLTTKELIFDKIWGDQFVTDTALSQCIKDIRKVLNDDAKSPRFIKTVPKHGFIFIKTARTVVEEEASHIFDEADAHPSRRPYKFLAFYSEEDSDLFFGREPEIKLICSKILSHRNLILYGRSGVGKSSIVHAGLLPALKNMGHFPLVIRSYHNPVGELIQSLKRLDLLVGEADLNNLTLPSDGSLICFVDQFEEFFLVTPEDVREKFVRFIDKIMSRPALQFRLVFVLREDLLAEMNYLKKIVPLVFHNEYRLEQLALGQAKQAIVEPAKKTGCRFQPELIERILEDLSFHQHVDPPQLQIVCDALYDNKGDSGHITMATYQSLGAARGILSKYLERVIQRFHSGDLPVAKKILSALISEDSRRLIVPVNKLEQQILNSVSGPEQFQALLAELSEARILRFQRQEGQTWVELTHDFLIPEVSRWQSDEDFDLKRAHSVMERALDNYRINGLLMDHDAIDFIIPLGDKLNITTKHYDLLAQSMLNKGRPLPSWLAEKTAHLADYIIAASGQRNTAVRLAAVNTARHTNAPELIKVLKNKAQWDEDLSVRRKASIILAENYGYLVSQEIYENENHQAAGLVRKAISIAYVRDYNKKLVPLRNLPLVISILVLFGLVAVRIRRKKEQLYYQTKGGALGAGFSGLMVGILVGLSLSFYRQATTYESLTLVLVLSSLGALTGFLGGLGISFGMSFMHCVGYRHSPYWAIPGSVLGGALLGGALNILGVDILRALFGQNLSGLAGAFEGAVVGLGLSAGYMMGHASGSGLRWTKVVLAAVGSMLAAIFLTLIKGNLFSTSIDTIAHSFANSQIDIEQLAKLFGEKQFGRLSRLGLAAFEGFLFGGFLALGMELYRKKSSKTP